jgi:hypothetical protein
MGRSCRLSENSDPLQKASLYRERAAECRLRAEAEDLGHTIRESYRQLSRSYEALAEEIEGGLAVKLAWKRLGSPSSFNLRS